MSIFNDVRRWFSKMFFGSKTIEQALNVKVLVNSDLQRQQQLWRDMIEGKAPWNNKDVPSLRLASSICKEAARHTTFEFEGQITGSPRADYLDEQYQRFIKTNLNDVSKLVGGGIIVFKPYPKGQRIFVTTVENNCFYPLRVNELGEITSVVFADTLQREDKHYTLLEIHEWNETKQEYTIKYKAFCAKHSMVNKLSNSIGDPIPLTLVEEWAHLQPAILYKNIPQPLFVECKLPDMQSLFAQAVEIIKEADEQLGRTIWEYLGGELAIDASIDLFKKDKHGNYVLPKGKERLFRTVDAGSGDFNIQTFSPTIRDESLFRGLNEYKRIIEFIIGFAYGVISDPNQKDRTAEEIRAGKQRLSVTVKGIQNIIQESHEKLIESMNMIATIYNLAPQGDYEASFVWGDSIMEDPDKEYTRLKELVLMGILKPEVLYAWNFGTTEEQALKEMPQMAEEMPDDADTR